MRLAKMCRGIAEPLCASYTCAYLARVGHEMAPNQKDYLYILIELMLKLYDASVSRGHNSIALEQYKKLFDPTIDWVVQCIAYQADRSTFKDIWALYSTNKKHPIFLKSIIRYFPSEIISVATTICL